MEKEKAREDGEGRCTKGGGERREERSDIWEVDGRRGEGGEERGNIWEVDGQRGERRGEGRGDI